MNVGLKKLQRCIYKKIQGFGLWPWIFVFCCAVSMWLSALPTEVSSWADPQRRNALESAAASGSGHRPVAVGTADRSFKLGGSPAQKRVRIGGSKWVRAPPGGSRHCQQD